MNFGGTVRINKSGVIVVVVIVLLFLLYSYKGKDDEEILRTVQKYQGPSSSVISLKKILVAAVDAAERGGAEVVKVRLGNGGKASAADLGEKLKGKTKEGADDLVTQGDFRSHRAMYYGMQKAFPEIKIISEEQTENEDSLSIPSAKVENEEISSILSTDEIVPANEVSVWIDPLDATQEYTENLVEYVTTMVCVAVRGVPVIGVIHRPFSKETFWGVLGHGNSVNLQEIAKKGRKKKSKKFQIVVSRSHAGKAQNYTRNVLGDKVDFEIIQAAGAGYKVLQVIEGKADAYLHVTLIKKWDLCAGNAILASVGGVMSTLDGTLLHYGADKNPVNNQGVLAYLNDSPDIIEKLKQIRLISS